MMSSITERSSVWKTVSHPCISMNTALKSILYHHNGETAALEVQMHHCDSVSFILEAVLLSVLVRYLIYSSWFLLPSSNNSKI